MLRRRAASTSPESWGRGKLLALLAGAALAATGLLAGLVLAVVSAFDGRNPATSSPTPLPSAHQVHRPPSVAERRDALAAAPMPTAAATDALPHALSAREPGVLTLPSATGTGPAGVPAGFPRTPAGALAQLAAIDVIAMQTGSLDGVRSVIDAWAAPGGPTGRTWSGVRGMASLLSAAGLPGAGSAQLAVVVRPAMGFIKGAVGGSYAVVCVDLEFTVTVERTARIAIADCQRMAWSGGRWRIGPGSEPARPPSVWPDTDLSIAVGYRELRHA